MLSFIWKCNEPWNTYEYWNTNKTCAIDAKRLIYFSLLYQDWFLYYSKLLCGRYSNENLLIIQPRQVKSL